MDTKITEILWELSQGKVGQITQFLKEFHGREWREMFTIDDILDGQQKWFFSCHFICSFKVHNHKNVISYQVL